MPLFNISFRGSKKRHKEKEVGTGSTCACWVLTAWLQQNPLAWPPPQSPTTEASSSWSSAPAAASEGHGEAPPCLRSALLNSSFSDPLDFAAAPAPFSSHSDEKLSAIVVGAGFAGLSASIALARQGWNVRVLERSGGPSKHGDCLVVSG